MPRTKTLHNWRVQRKCLWPQLQAGFKCRNDAVPTCLNNPHTTNQPFFSSELASNHLLQDICPFWENNPITTSLMIGYGWFQTAKRARKQHEIYINTCQGSNEENENKAFVRIKSAMDGHGSSLHIPSTHDLQCLIRLSCVSPADWDVSWRC